LPAEWSNDQEPASIKIGPEFISHGLAQHSCQADQDGLVAFEKVSISLGNSWHGSNILVVIACLSKDAPMEKIIHHLKESRDKIATAERWQGSEPVAVQ
jgi:hypothetical protein